LDKILELYDNTEVVLGGDKKIFSEKLSWNTNSRIDSLGL
jgi:hypothetical protein